jgi:type III pantothenate kinase
MNLIIDIGNSQTKVAIFHNRKMLKNIITDEFNPELLHELKAQYSDLTHAILSSVDERDEKLIEILYQEFELFIELNYLTPIPIENLYESKKSLGQDRLAAAIGANHLFPGSDLLVIDAGTAITYDVVDSQNRFLGGNISPGLETRFRSLHEFTKKLPLIEISDQWPLIGKTTEEAIRAGVQAGVLFEMDAMIDRIRDQYVECRVVLTGGDSFFFDQKLRNTIFVIYELTLLGLNRILEYNAEKK